MVVDVLAGLLSVPADTIRMQPGSDGGADVVVSAGGQRFAIECKGSSSPGLVEAVAKRAADVSASTARNRTIPLVAVPFMSASGRRVCERAGLGWFDLSGNARIVAPGLRIVVDGQPNKFPKRGRPSSVFAPKSSRVARWLLMHPDKAHTQRALALATMVSEGLVSRIISRLEREKYVARSDGIVRLTNPRLLLDAWQDEYRFSKHTIIEGHVAARSGDALTRNVADLLSAGKLDHAATGLSAAWQFNHFAGFRIATFFVEHEPNDAIRRELGFRQDPRGANLWLVVPNDDGVFHGADDCEGVRCVHPVQAYLDLKGHPERARDAAERLRAETLSY